MLLQDCHPATQTVDVIMTLWSLTLTPESSMPDTVLLYLAAAVSS